MTDETELMLQRWERRSGEVLDVTDEIGPLALRIVNRSLFSAEVGTIAQGFAQALWTANAILGDFFRFPFPPLNFPTSRNRKLHRSIAEMDALLSKFIRARLQADAARGGEALDEEPDLLTLLLHAVDEEDGKGMDPEQLHHDVLNICIGAFETTTNTLCCVFYLLARHPEVEARLHTEVDAVLGERTVVSFEDLRKLPYARMVIDETLRIYSPAYQFMRRAREEDTVDGYGVPANTNILINSYFLHRHPDFWQDPERFDPERFTPEAIATRPKHVYTPFGAGHRICIGRHFALTELILVLATVARQHRPALPDVTTEVLPEALITLHPKGGIHVRLEERR